MRVFERICCAGLKFSSIGGALLVAGWTFTGAPSATAQDSTGGHRIAVVDVAYIFKNHPSIQEEVAKVEQELKTFDAELNTKREELQRTAQMMKEYKPGSPEYAAAEEQIAGMESRLRLEMARKRKELTDAEAKIYFENYQKIAAGVKYLANYYKINLVLRHNSEEMKIEQGDTVARGVMKSIVYHDDSLDMTKGIMQYLDTAGGRVAKEATKPVR